MSSCSWFHIYSMQNWVNPSYRTKPQVLLQLYQFSKPLRSSWTSLLPLISPAFCIVALLWGQTPSSSVPTWINQMVACMKHSFPKCPTRSSAVYRRIIPYPTTPRRRRLATKTSLEKWTRGEIITVPQNMPLLGVIVATEPSAKSYLQAITQWEMLSDTSPIFPFQNSPTYRPIRYPSISCHSFPSS